MQIRRLTNHPACLIWDLVINIYYMSKYIMESNKFKEKTWVFRIKLMI